MDRAGGLVRLCCRKYKDDVGRGLFQYLEEGVKCRGGEHVDFINNVDLVTPLQWGILRPLLELSHIIHTRMGCAVNLYDINGEPGCDVCTRLTLHAGNRCGAFGAIERLCQYPRHRGLPDTPHPGEEVGMGDAVRLYGILQGL